ncbi:MAG: hypothetical protein QXV22_05570, partial [Thermoplasmataceae archaeon]
MPEDTSSQDASAELTSLFSSSGEWQRLPDDFLEKLANYLERSKSSGTLKTGDIDFLVKKADQLRHLSYAEFSKLCDIIEIVTPGNQQLEKLKFHKLFNAGKHERAADLIVQGKLTDIDKDTISAVMELDVPESILGKLLLILARKGVFPESILWEFFKSGEAHPERINILGEMNKSGDKDLALHLALESLK